MYRYEIFGLKISSYFESDYLKTSIFNDPDIIIQNNQDLIIPKDISESNYAGGDLKKYKIYKKNYVYIEIIEGKFIHIKHINESISSKYLSSIVLNAPLGFCLYQRGELVLHASSIESSGKAILFMGASGSGKSTLSGFLNKKYNFITEDLAKITFFNKSAFISRTAPYIKLSDEVAKILKLKNGYRVGSDKSNRSYYKVKNYTYLENIKVSKCYILKWGKEFSVKKASDDEVLKYFLLCNHSAYPYGSCAESSLLQLQYLEKMSKIIDFYVLERPKSFKIQIDENFIKIE